MKKLFIASVSLLFVVILISTASATSSLWDWAFYIDGATFEKSKGHSMPVSGALDAEGLGTLTWQTNAAGLHRFIAFFDHEIDEKTNTYFNEYGEAINTPNAGQSWEIDEPGFVFGDIYDNVLGGSLDNTNGVPQATPNDVSMAMGWGFTLTAGQNAIITLALAGTAPGSGFYLSHRDPDSQQAIFFSSALNIQGGGGPAPIPEPGTVILLFFGIFGIFGLKGWLLKN